MRLLSSQSSKVALMCIQSDTVQKFRVNNEHALYQLTNESSFEIQFYDSCWQTIFRYRFRERNTTSKSVVTGGKQCTLTMVCYISTGGEKLETDGTTEQ